MGTKKNNELSLEKETIASLSSFEQSKFVGGITIDESGAGDAWCVVWSFIIGDRDACKGYLDHEIDSSEACESYSRPPEYC